MQSLFDSQSAAIDKLKHYKVGALFMQPGTGKTRTALELINTIDSCDYVLWLTPCQTQQNLRDELTKWDAPHIQVHGIESLSASDALYLQLRNQLNNAKCACVIVDESLKIKNFAAKRTKRIIELGKLAAYKLILNGTPVSRNILDIWAQMEFLSPHILKMSLAEFKNTYCEWKRRSDRNTGRVIEWIIKYHNVDHLYSLIQHYVYEADLELNLLRQYITVLYKLDDDTMQEYQRLKQYYLSQELLLQKDNNIFMEMTTKMQHSYAACTSKLKALQQIIDANAYHKIIVFCKYTSSADAIRNNFKQVTVLTYGKHSYGLNMQDYNVIVFFDKTWDYAQRLQAERRIFRKGQKHNCTYYTLHGNVPLENLINDNIDKKINLLNHLKSLTIKQINQTL